jgi:Fur family peroxide stress response transcriptional regulator
LQNRQFLKQGKFDADLTGCRMLTNSAGLKKKLEDFHKLCRQAGLKMTPQRLVIYAELLKTTQHPSAEQLHQKIKKIYPNISLDTVNRTLLTLSEIGAAFIVEGSGDPKRFDANLTAHQHFRCIKCKKIFDFHHKPYDDFKLPPDIAKKFTILRKTVYLEGLCDLCKQKCG